MGREPRSQQRAVALAGVDVNAFISVFTVAVDDVFGVEGVVVIERLVCPKSISIDGQRLLLVVVEQESHSRFVGGFRRDHVAVVRVTVNEREHGWFVALVRTTPTRGQATRVRPEVALAAFEFGRNVHFADLSEECVERVIPAVRLDASESTEISCEGGEVETNETIDLETCEFDE